MATGRHQHEVERWFDGAAADARDVEKHIEGCPECAAHLNELKRIRAAIHAAKIEAEIGEEQFPAFMRGIEEGIAAPKRSPVGRWAMASALAAALIVALSVISIVSPGTEPIQAITIEESSTDIDGATTESVVVNEETTMVWINLPDRDML